MQPPCPDDNRNDLEQRLSSWRPAPQGLSSDDMLFAAGQASARVSRGRNLWPAMAACLALAAVFLGGWAVTERAGRLALANQLQQQAPLAAPEMRVADARAPIYHSAAVHEPEPDSYLACHRALAEDIDAWLDNREYRQEARHGEASQHVPVWRVWQRDQVVVP